MKLKLNMMGFVFSFVFLIGMGGAVEIIVNKNYNYEVLATISALFIAAVGYYFIVSITQNIIKEKEVDDDGNKETN